MDKARRWTDRHLVQMEKKISKIYKEAYDGISASWDKYMKSHASKLDKAYDDLQIALKSGDNKTIAEARAVYERTAKNITLNNTRFKEMRDEVAEKLSHVNEIAVNYLNDNMASIYTTNYNAFGDVPVKGYSFSLTNEQAVKNLATRNKAFLPTKKLDIAKDMAWNEKAINSQVLQGILQGESIPKMAKRLVSVVDMNEKSSIRNARTMTTAAENKGRQDSFKKAESDGVIMTRTWVATSDDRTRAWHTDLNGVEVGVDEPWSNEYGKIMYPGDPSADPANVYNCRCSIRARVKGFKWNEKEVSNKADELIQDGYSHSIYAKGGSLTYTVVDYGSKFVFVEDIEVDKNIRGQGVGTLLLNKIKDMADENELDIKLTAVPIHGNRMTTEELIEWYKKRGFEQLTNKKKDLLIYKAKRKR